MKPLIRANTDCFWKLLICGKSISQHFNALSTNQSIRYRLNGYLKVFWRLEVVKSVKLLPIMLKMWQLEWVYGLLMFCIKQKIRWYAIAEMFCNFIFYFIFVSIFLYADKPLELKLLMLYLICRFVAMLLFILVEKLM